jgi:hypothetical protein
VPGHRTTLIFSEDDQAVLEELKGLLGSDTTSNLSRRGLRALLELADKKTNDAALAVCIPSS